MSAIGFLPLPQSSHVSATFGLAKALRSRGHRVTYLAPLDFEEAITSQALEYTPVCEDLLPKGACNPIGPLFTDGQTMARLFEMVCAGEFDELIRRSRLDLILADSYAQQLAFIGYKVGIPTLLLSPTMPRARNSWILSPTQPLIGDSRLSRWKARLYWYGHDLRKLHWLKRSVRDPFLDRIAISAKYPVRQIDYSGYFPILKLIPELILCPREFDLPRPGSRSPLHYIGAYADLQRNETQQFPWDRIEQNKPLIYCALGSLSERFGWARAFLQNVIDAVNIKDDLQIVIATGPHLGADDFSGAGSNVILVDSAPQIEVLKRAALMITHGGFNSIKECILQRVPMIVFHRSKTVNAVRVAYHGLGLIGDVNQTSAGQVRSMIDAILADRSFRQRTEAMRERFIAADRSNLGVKAVELVINARSTKVLTKNSLT